jgi:hypothetical protein
MAKTLEEALTDYVQRQSKWQADAARFYITEPFLAGAAAMAELFANGHGLKVSHQSPEICGATSDVVGNGYKCHLILGHSGEHYYS